MTPIEFITAMGIGFAMLFSLIAIMCTIYLVGLAIYTIAREICATFNRRTLPILIVISLLSIPAIAQAGIGVASNVCEDENLDVVIDFPGIIAEIERELETAREQGMVTKELEQAVDAAQMPFCILEWQMLELRSVLYDENRIVETEAEAFGAVEMFRHSLLGFGAMVWFGPTDPSKSPYSYDLDRLASEVGILKKNEETVREAWERYEEHLDARLHDAELELERLRSEEKSDVFEQKE